MARQKVTTFLWFDNNALEAATFYVTLFKDSQIRSVMPGPTGAPWVVEFTLAGTDYIALNGGPHFKLTEAVSLSVECADQAEIDDLWEKLSEGDTKGQCGWITDRFGLTWQIVPSVLSKMMSDPDKTKTKRVMDAFMPMTKLDIATLQKAYEG